MSTTYLIAALALSLAICSCEKKNTLPVFPPEWQQPEQPQQPIDPSVQKRCFIWIEGNANFKDYGDSKENIAKDMAKIADCGFTDIIVDVRPAGAGGDVLYKTDKCPQVDFMGAWINGQYVKVSATPTGTIFRHS